MLLFESGSAHSTKFRFLYDSTRPHLHYDGLPLRSVVSILRVRNKYYKNIVLLFWSKNTERPSLWQNSGKITAKNYTRVVW